MGDDVYCERILNGIEPVDIVFETTDVVAYHYPLRFFTDAHVLVVPKRHVASLVDPGADDVLPARVMTNLGRYQDSKHLHVHVCAGDALDGTGRRPLSGAERAVLPLGSGS